MANDRSTGLPVQPHNAALPTEENEEDVLDALYGYPDEDGVYRGTGG